jgi:hypothetical protein
MSLFRQTGVGMAEKYTESGMRLAFKSMIVTGALALEFLCAVPGYADDSRPPAASSQKTPIKRTVLRRTDVPRTDFEVVYALIEIPPINSMTLPLFPADWH